MVHLKPMKPSVHFVQIFVPFVTKNGHGGNRGNTKNTEVLLNFLRALCANLRALCDLKKGAGRNQLRIS